MAGHTRSNGSSPRVESAPSPGSHVPRVATAAAWTSLSVAVARLAAGRFGLPAADRWAVPGVLVVDGLAAVMWLVAASFGVVVVSFSRRYLAGDPHRDRFLALVVAFTLAVATTVAAAHVALFAAAWLAMGLVMAELVGHVDGWPQARAAERHVRRHVLASTALVGLGLLVLSWSTGETALHPMLDGVGSLSPAVALVAVGALVLAAMVQSALVPFHGWLFSAMTAPTPASALMHAGFVNAGGLLLTRFAPLVVEAPGALQLLVLVGAASALFGQAALLVQTDVKGALGASTVAQMGFMVLQCGLGFFGAAVAHLVLHGCYKAALFLSSPGAVERTAPGSGDGGTLSATHLAASLLVAAGAAALFAGLTGKGLAAHSGLVLALAVGLTTAQATRDLLARPALSWRLRLAGAPVIAGVAVGSYAAVYAAVSTLLADVPATTAPTGFTVVQLAVGVAFVLASVVTALGWHRDSTRLYVRLLEATRPAPETVVSNREVTTDA